MKVINGRLVNPNNITDIVLDREKMIITVHYNTIVETVSVKNGNGDLTTCYTYNKEEIKFDNLDDCLLQYERTRGW